MSLTVIDRETYQFVLAPERPCWVATNAPGAALLAGLAKKGEAALGAAIVALAASDGLTPVEAEAIVKGFAADGAPVWRNSGNGAYAGRGAYLRPTHLRELWIHLNNRCNFTCRHCLVSSGPQRDDGLPPETLRKLLDEAHVLGCRTFFFTGGEPLLRPDLPSLLQQCLGDPAAHVVVLTNGSLVVESFLSTVAGLDRERLHLQVSLDGSAPELNDALRAKGSFEAATRGIRRALDAGLDTTVATVVLDANLADLPSLALVLARLGVKSWHLMWQHLRERGARERRAEIEVLIERVLDLKRIAADLGLTLDNFDNFRAILNGEPNTKRDGTNACWDSLAVHADGAVYPSASLVGIDGFRVGSILEQPLRDLWLASPVADSYRRQTVAPNGSLNGDPLAFLHGGGDPEHAFFSGNGTPGAGDPYLPLYRALLLDAADDIVGERLERMGAREDVPVVYHVMGQDGLGCPVEAGVENTGPHRLDFVRSNCVLKQDVVGYARKLVQDYYGEAAVVIKGEICCPVTVDRRYFTHIPKVVLERSYGCGSPLFAAEVQAGETLLDLGSGGGIECFAAAKMVGPGGRVLGIDMTVEMLALANSARPQVAENLGYDNVRFIRGYLEGLPLPSNFADVITSNCVINLSPQKFKVFAEILRVLKPGGRMVLSDIVAGEAVPERVKFHPQLKGECIGGALTLEEFLPLLTKLGFADVRTLGELPWREVEGVEFFADTVVAVKPEPLVKPLPYVGIRRVEHGTRGTATPSPARDHLSGCIVCGADLQYLQTALDSQCAKCGRSFSTRARCADGHFVCDQCHGGDHLRFLRSYLAQCEGTDPLQVFLEMREAYAFPVHGPEHHALVPAAFLTAYSNLHGYPDPARVWQTVESAAKLPGGSCAFWGACSAALGMGMALSTILEATPLKAKERNVSQEFVSRVLKRIAEFQAPRCCRRESLVSLQMACELSGELLPHPVGTTRDLQCDQVWANLECVGEACPFAPGR